MTTLHEDLLSLDTNLGDEINAARAQLKYGKELIKDAKARLRSGYTKVAEVQRVLDLSYPPAPPAPRVWQSLDQVPFDVAVTSGGGCRWSYWDEQRSRLEGKAGLGLRGWMWSSSVSAKHDRSAPFTEIIEERK